MCKCCVYILNGRRYYIHQLDGSAGPGLILLLISNPYNHQSFPHPKTLDLTIMTEIIITRER